MEESEWQHASWVSALGKWAWIIGLINGLIGIIASLVAIISLGIFAIFGISVFIWNIIASIIGIAIALLIIRPKFSVPCGKKDWDALYGWVLNLGGTKIPWMFLWGLLLFLFGWYGWGGLAVLIPAVMLIFAGPKEFEWSEKKAE
ncbi:MAG: hypothetical protein HWN80_01780 [Candidatus Lokiarchaeota archaeon]|nr:hypothetical protein [Candidatus Lokiarchaeota archaeon]